MLTRVRKFFMTAISLKLNYNFWFMCWFSNFPNQ
jgi:hypothetical protein